MRSRDSTVPSCLLRIISDIHFGDRSTSVHSFEQLAPLLEGAAKLICNGDTTDTRPGLTPAVAAERSAQLASFAQQSGSRVQFVTGNHDPQISTHHHLDLAHGAVLVTHGDVVFDEVVPWGADAALARELVARARRESLPADDELHSLLQAHRRATSAIPQRQQASTHGPAYLHGFLSDPGFPPSRIWRILKAWHQMPRRCAALLQRHRPNAHFILVGHTHRPGIWRRSDGRVMINTGSFSPPLGQLLVEIEAEQLRVRRVQRKHGNFHPGKIVAQFSLTPPDPSLTPLI